MSARGARSRFAAGSAAQGDALLVCLVKLARSFGRSLSAAEIRTAAGTDRVTVEAALRAATRLGLTARRLPAGPVALAGLPPPFILIEADGPEAKPALEALIALVENGFGEED